MEVKEALEKAELARSYWSDIYQDFRDDVRFSIGLDHWRDDEIRDRGENACMIVPVLPQFIHQVTNDMRQNTPSINVLPGEGAGDVETAQIFKGIIRKIEYRSRADEVYDTGGEYAVRGGFGFARVDHDYISDDSFLQELKLIRVQNPESVYLDPSFVECDGSDAEWGFILDPINKDDFERKYPDKEFITFDKSPTDSKAEAINLCEFFIKEYTTIKKMQSDDGEMIDDDESDDKKTRRVLKKCTVKRYRFSGADLLEETTFPGKYIPIVPFLGEEVWVEGKRNWLSLIRLAKDAQRRVNKWASKESEILDMAPIAPVMAPVGAVEDFMDEWGDPGKVNVMRYRTVDAAGNPLEKPERLNPPSIPTGIINAMEGAKESVKEALGMYNASIGQRSNAISGVAYDAQKTESDVATFHFLDNRNRSIQQIGRILVSAIPEVIDTDRLVPIIDEEDEPQTIGVNGAMAPDQDRHYDLKKGKYDVRVTTGASYTTKRQETAALLGDVLTKNPQLMQVMGDLYFKNLDVAGADAMAERIKKTIPPALTQDDKGAPPPDPEKQHMAQIIQQGAQQIQQLSQELQSKQQEFQLKMAEIQVKQQEVQVKAQEAQTKAQQPNGIDPLDLQKAQMDMQKQQFDEQYKTRELQLKEAEFQLKVQQANQPKTDLASQPGIKLDTTGFQMMKTPEQVEADCAVDHARLAVEAQQLVIEQQENEQRQLQAAALLNALNGITSQLAALGQPKPITVVRNADGQITGAI